MSQSQSDSRPTGIIERGELVAADAEPVLLATN